MGGFIQSIGKGDFILENKMKSEGVSHSRTQETWLSPVLIFCFLCVILYKKKMFSDIPVGVFSG